MNEPELPKFEDLPEELQLMMQRDALYNEMQRWAGDRDKQRKIQGELDAVLKDKDPERLAEVVKLQGHINTMLSAVHFEGADDSPDSFIGEELPLKRERYVQLMTQGEAPEWVKRLRTNELIIHCTEEELRCRDEIDAIETKLRPYEEKRRKHKHAFDFSPEAVAQAYMDEPPEPWELEDHRTDAEIERDELLFEIDIMQETADWEQMSSEREVRKKQEEIQRLKTENLYEYIDQLEGLVEDINEDWQRAVGGLGDMEIGRTVDVYFNGKHPRECLALRYREDLGSTAKWNVEIRNKRGANKFTVKQTFPPYKEYVMSLGLDKRNHVFAFNFLSPRGGWFDAEREVGPHKSQWKQLRTLEFFEAYDKINKHLQEKKANG